ncbi:HNRL2 protein, partial [Machaerirhynchus nigripectus]|nr:HNRL2 protein [Machaerirhynchus nigripectus]
EAPEPGRRFCAVDPGSFFPGKTGNGGLFAGDEEEKAKAAGSEGERRGVKRLRDEKDEHGRAYHEFREEAYNSRSKSPPPPEEEPPEGEEDETLVILDTYTSDLQFRASRDRYGGQPLFSERFPGLWAGARSTHGVTRGRVCFQAKVTQNLPVKEGSSEVPLLRVGWSVDFSHSQLGEDEFSYGFDGRGLKVENGKFEEFGESFGENDVIGCFADFEGEELVELSFSKNGQDLGSAFRIPKESLGERALLPHVLCKGCAVELNFGQRPEPPAPVPDGFVFIHAVPAPERVRTPPGPKSTEECEVLLMVGLPGSGKTQWAQKHSQENRDKRYNILGTERVLHQLRLPSSARCPQKPQKSGIKPLEPCSRSRIPDFSPNSRFSPQCNVYNSGQRRKLSAFKGFSRKVVVIVPPEPEWEQRLERRREAEGDDVPESVMLEMKGRPPPPPPPAATSSSTRYPGTAQSSENRPRNQGKPAQKSLQKSPIKWDKMGPGDKRNPQNRGPGYVGGQRRGYDSRVYGGQQQPQYWGQPGNGYRNFYERYRGYDDRFYGRDYDYNRYRDYYRQYNREWQNYYQDRDRYYRNYYGYQGYR